MVVKNNLTKKFIHNKNGTTIKVSNYLRTGVRFGKTKKMVKDQNTVFPNKDSSMTKVMKSTVNLPPIKTHSPMKKRIETHSPMKKRIKTHSPMKKRIKAHSPMKAVKYNLSKGFKWSYCTVNQFHGSCLPSAPPFHPQLNRTLPSSTISCIPIVYIAIIITFITTFITTIILLIVTSPAWSWRHHPERCQLQSKSRWGRLVRSTS